MSVGCGPFVDAPLCKISPASQIPLPHIADVPSDEDAASEEEETSDDALSDAVLLCEEEVSCEDVASEDEDTSPEELSDVALLAADDVSDAEDTASEEEDVVEEEVSEEEEPPPAAASAKSLMSLPFVSAVPTYRGAPSSNWT